MAVVAVKLTGIRIERAMHRMDNRDVDPVGHRYRGKAAMVVDHIERRPGAAEFLDTGEHPSHMIDFEQCPLDVVRVRPRQDRLDPRGRRRTRRRE